MEKSTRFIDQSRPFIPADSDFVSRKYIDLTYADGSPRRKQDIYLPNTGNGPFPVIIDVYGGGWCFGEKSSFKLNLSLELIKRGYAVVSINYTLSKEALFPIQIYEIKAAIRYVKQNAQQFLLDPNCVAVIGESAGAHLSSVAAMSVGAGVFEDIPFGPTGDADIQALILLYCPTELARSAAQFHVLGVTPVVKEIGTVDSPEGLLLGGNLSEIPEKVQEANPIHYITPKAPPTLFFHGTEDRVVPILQSQIFAMALTEQIGMDNVEYHAVPGVGHSHSAFLNEGTVQTIHDFLKKHLI